MVNIDNLQDEKSAINTIEKNADQRYNPTSSEEDNKRMVFLEAICEMLVNYKNLEERKHE